MLAPTKSEVFSYGLQCADRISDQSAFPAYSAVDLARLLVPVSGYASTKTTRWKVHRDEPDPIRSCDK